METDMIGDLLATVITVTAFVVAIAYTLACCDGPVFASSSRDLERFEMGASINNDMPNMSGNMTRAPQQAMSFAALDENHIYSFFTYHLSHQFHVPPATVQVLIDAVASGIGVDQPEAARYVKRALYGYGSFERAATWLEIEIVTERAFVTWSV